MTPRTGIGLRLLRAARNTLLVSLLALAPLVTTADDTHYRLNFDLTTRTLNGEMEYNIRLQGIHLQVGEPFQGSDLNRYQYFLTLNEVTNGVGVLTIEVYQYADAAKRTGIASEIVSSVDVVLGQPAVFEAASLTFAVDVAFSIVAC